MNAQAGPGDPGSWHAVVVYRDPAEFDAAACGFAEAAAQAGAAVLISCTGPPLGRLQARLSALGDQVAWADMASMGANPARLIPALSRFADQHPGRPAWCVQEAAWASRPPEELWEVIRHEALMNLALADSQVRLLCLYHAELAAELISCAEATHPVIGRGGRWQPSTRYRHGSHAPVPRQCDQPLPPPPASARTLRYRDDLGGLRRLVATCAQAVGLPSRRAEDLLIAVSELAANTFAHTAGPGTLMVWATGSRITCQIHDTGHIADPLAGQRRPDPAADGRGRGLWLVHQLCDLVQVRTGPAGTTIRVHMPLAP
jgi:anti-sigma regulatory factor (Ser/Thr protein kinase)